MKIGVLTFFKLANYGANLQAYSTYRYLKDKGHDVVFIDWAPDDYYKRSIASKIEVKDYKHHFSFVKENLPVSERCRSDIDICRIIDEYGIQAILIGSDAVLQNHPLLERISFPSRKFLTVSPAFSTTTFPSPYWGSFLRCLGKKIPVAVMSGSSQDSMFFFIFGKERRQMKEYIEQFTYISVRDSWTQKMIRYLTRGRVVPDITPDPVFALSNNASDVIPSKAEVTSKFNLPEQYVLFSFWNNSIVSCDWLKRIGDLFSERGVTPVAFPMPGGVKFNHPFPVVVDIPTPLEWYSIISNASAYIGEKMHPIVSCLANSVPCFNFDHCGVKYCKGLFRYSKSSKIYHIMNEFGFKDNRINGSGLLYKEPSPQYVLEKILAFNKEKCSKKEENYLARYNDMMSTILTKFEAFYYE